MSHHNTTRPQHGFTLLELIVVIAVLAALSAIGFVGYQTAATNTDCVATTTERNTIDQLFRATSAATNQPPTALNPATAFGADADNLTFTTTETGSHQVAASGRHIGTYTPSDSIGGTGAWIPDNCDNNNPGDETGDPDNNTGDNNDTGGDQNEQNGPEAGTDPSVWLPWQQELDTRFVNKSTATNIAPDELGYDDFTNGPATGIEEIQNVAHYSALKFWHFDTNPTGDLWCYLPAGTIGGSGAWLPDNCPWNQNTSTELWQQTFNNRFVTTSLTNSVAPNELGYDDFTNGPATGIEEIQNVAHYSALKFWHIDTNPAGDLWCYLPADTIGVNGEWMPGRCPWQTGDQWEEWQQQLDMVFVNRSFTHNLPADQLLFEHFEDSPWSRVNQDITGASHAEALKFWQFFGGDDHMWCYFPADTIGGSGQWEDGICPWFG